MKKIYTCLTASLSLCFFALTASALPNGEDAIMVSQLEATDFITLAGLAFLLLGLLFVLLSVYAGLKKKNDPLDDYDDYDDVDYLNDEDMPEAEEQSESVTDEDDDETENEDIEEEPTDEPEAEPEPAVEEPKIRITLTGTNNPDVRFAEFTDRCTLGRRNTNDIMISDNAVSGNHCEFIAEEDKIIIRDLNSTNGTLLNGNSITAEEINSGDLIIVGKLQYRISIMK